MKRQIITAGFLLFAVGARSQEPPRPPSLEERIKKTNEILQKDLQLNAQQQKQVEDVFKDFFTAMDKLHKENPPPPPPPPDPKVKEAMDKLVEERDAKVKKLLSEEQFKNYKETEKKLHPPKPGEENKAGMRPAEQQQTDHL